MRPLGAVHRQRSTTVDVLILMGDIFSYSLFLSGFHS